MAQHSSVYDEGYDSLDVSTRAAMAYVQQHRPRSEPARLAELAPKIPPEVARTLIVADTACDLPQAWLDQHSVSILPRSVRVEGREFLETRANTNVVKLLDHFARGGEAPSQSLPLAAAAMRNEMHQWLGVNTDSVLLLCLSARRSRMYVNALAATQSLVLIHNKVRRLAGNRAPLTAWVIDSANALGGVGVLLSHAVRLRESGMMPANIAVTLNTFRNSVHTLVAPHDMAFVARSARSIEHRPIAGWKVSLATLLDFKPILHFNADRVAAIARVRGQLRAVEDVLTRLMHVVEAGALATPFIALSYAGKLEDIESLQSYKVLRAWCNRHQIAMSLTMMSATGVLMLGPRALAASFASQQFRGE